MVERYVPKLKKVLRKQRLYYVIDLLKDFRL